MVIGNKKANLTAVVGIIIIMGVMTFTFYAAYFDREKPEPNPCLTKCYENHFPFKSNEYKSCKINCSNITDTSLRIEVIQ